MRIAVLGAGRIGQVHAKAVRSVEGAVLHSITDPVEEAARAVAAEHGCAVATMDEVEAGGADAVLICTPTDTHADLIERFARARKAVFCEKPVDLSVARVKECLRVVDETGAFLMIGFQRRFEPDFRTVRAAIDDGRIGRVENVALVSRDPSPPPLAYQRHCGGIFRDMTIHDFDVARWMLGEDPVEVYASASALFDEAAMELGDFDSANTVLRCESGAMATIHNTRRVTYGYDQRIEVHGSKGSVSALNHAEARVQFAGEDGYTVPPNQHFFLDRYMEAYRLEIAAFVKAAQAGEAPPSSGHDGLMALALAEAADLSARENRPVRVGEVLGA